MIYHLARKYDEWPGEDYDGSSCRGAMKGWFHHGVCSDALWPYRDADGFVRFLPPDPRWTADAAQRPLGAYYRVTKDSITDLQAAVNEVGAVYVSADVHRGWDSVVRTKAAIPTIPWKAGAESVGGHAFALVGYDAQGFVLQNSWGEGWGFHGFARITYDDWLANGNDAWVAVMGAPIAARAPAITLASLRTVSASEAHLSAGLVNGATAAVVATAPRADAWDIPTAVHHTMILGNDGFPDHVTLEDADAVAVLERICYRLPKAWLKTARHGKRRIAVYAHGGLNDLAAGLDRAQVMGPWFERNGIPRVHRLAIRSGQDHRGHHSRPDRRAGRAGAGSQGALPGRHGLGGPRLPDRGGCGRPGAAGLEPDEAERRGRVGRRRRDDDARALSRPARRGLPWARDPPGRALGGRHHARRLLARPRGARIWRRGPCRSTHRRAPWRSRTGTTFRPPRTGSSIRGASRSTSSRTRTSSTTR
jgi:hypothetical protein